MKKNLKNFTEYDRVSLNTLDVIIDKFNDLNKNNNNKTKFIHEYTKNSSFYQLNLVLRSLNEELIFPMYKYINMLR